MAGTSIDKIDGANLVEALFTNPLFLEKMGALGLEQLAKADTISQANNFLWYDLARVVQMVYPYKELIPCISRLPREGSDGGNAFHWKRVVAINPGNISAGVSEGNRGARIGVLEQDAVATYRTLGLENSVTFEARLGSRNLNPEVLGIAVQSTLRSVMIQEEQNLQWGNSSTPLGLTPTPTLVAGTVTNLTGAFSSATVYVCAVALAGQGYQGYSGYNSVSGLGGVPGLITKINADNSSDTIGGGSAQPSIIASVGTSGTQCVTATVTAVAGAVGGYAWYVGTTANSPSTMYLAGITPSNQAIFSKVPPTTNQPLSNLYVNGVGQDNSTNLLVPDGILPQIFGAVNAPDPGRTMATNPLFPSGVSVSKGGSLLYVCPSGNTGLTINGSTIAEFDALLQAAYDQYKVPFNKIMMSTSDMLDTFGNMLSQSTASNIYRLLLEADASDGRIVAGRKVTSYLNKFMNNTLDVEVHPYMPPGTIVFWSDRIPYELSGIQNILEAKVRQDYYQIQWPWRSRRYEYGVYVDEVFPCYFTPAFAAITNKNLASGTYRF